jgi:catechol 2,3-dioxygenase
MTSIAADTRMGAVTLDVADLDAMIRFYRDGVGLTLLTNEGGVATLGRGSTILMVLRHAPGLKHAGPREAGLFHTAILFETEPGLAAVVLRVAQNHPTLFTGSADHLVSKAFYFDDPEGNGVELYWDRPRDQWQISGHTIQMDTLPLDPNAFLTAHITEDAVAEHGSHAITVGHVHLSVGDVETAHEFYVNRLGFDETFRYGGQAMFVSAGGYHHHMAMNTWKSRGAGVRQPALGLGLLDITLPTADDRGAIVERLTHEGHQVRDDGQIVAVDDPWGNIVTLKIA